MSWYHKFGKEFSVRKAVTVSKRHDEFVMAKIKAANLFLMIVLTKPTKLANVLLR